MATAPSSLIPPFFPPHPQKKKKNPQTTFPGHGVEKPSGISQGMCTEIPTHVPRLPLPTGISNKMRILGIIPVFFVAWELLPKGKRRFLHENWGKAENSVVFSPHVLPSLNPWINLFSLDSNWEFPHPKKKKKLCWERCSKRSRMWKRRGKGDGGGWDPNSALEFPPGIPRKHKTLLEIPWLVFSQEIQLSCGYPSSAGRGIVGIWLGKDREGNGFWF